MLGRWSTGFELVRVEGDGSELRRMSDRTVLPVVFDAARVRPAARFHSVGMTV